MALIIKDAQPEPAMKRVFFTPLDWRLLRDCPVPVHLVTDSRNPRPRRILAIVDVLRSEDQDLVFNDQIVDAAVKLAEQCNAQVELLHAFDWTAVYASDMGIGALPLATGLYEALGQAQHEVFESLAERHGVAPQQRHFIEGAPLEQHLHVRQRSPDRCHRHGHHGASWPGQAPGHHRRAAAATGALQRVGDQAASVIGVALREAIPRPRAASGAKGRAGG